MSLFQLNEDIHDIVNMNAMSKSQLRNNFKNVHYIDPKSKKHYIEDDNLTSKERKDLGGYLSKINRSDGVYSAMQKAINMDKKSNLALLNKEKRENLGRFKTLMHGPHQGKYDHYASCKEEAELNDVSTSPAVKKFLNINNNSSDLNAVNPNQEYNDSYDKFFVADGDDPKTSKFNIPAALAAKTAGGDPHSDTFNNGVNKVKSSDVFKLKPVKDETEETSFKA